MADITLIFEEQPISLALTTATPINLVLDGGATYTAGTGISITGAVISNTAPNVVQELSISGQDLTLSGGGGTVEIPGLHSEVLTGDVLIDGAFVSNVEFQNTNLLRFAGAAVVFQAVSSLDFNSESTTYNIDNEFNLNVAGNTLFQTNNLGIQYGSYQPDIITNPQSIPDVQGVLELIASTPVEGVSLGTGFTAGGGSGSIPSATVAGLTGDGFSFAGQAPFFIFTDNGGGSGANVEIIQEGSINMSTYGDKGSSIAMTLSPSDGAFTALGANLEFKAGDNESLIAFNMNDQAALFLDAAANTVSFTDNRATPIGIEYTADYSATIAANPRSIPDVGTVDLLKQTPVSYTNAAAPNNCIFYSTTLSKLCYKDPGGTVNPLY